LREALKAKDELGVLTQASAAIEAFQKDLQPKLVEVLTDVQAASGKAAVRELRTQMRTAGFDPDQPRDEKGKWSPAAGGTETSYSHLNETFPKAGETVDGRKVRDGVPNEASIGASLDDYEVLPGVREVQMSDMDPDYQVKPYSTKEEERLNILTEQIRQSNEISPLIVVVDDEKHPYILEGGHRYDALRKLKAKSFPAKVVVDKSKLKITDLKARMADDIEMAFDVTNPRAVEWIRQHSADLIDGLSETTRDEIRDLIEESFTEQYDVDDLVEKIDEIIGDRDRAEEIAHTETMRASNEGQLEAWNQAVDAGLLTGNETKEWIVTPDDKLCPICEPLDGVNAPLNGLFDDQQGGQIDQPPAHPRCRCTIALTLAQ
jgi:hypothetical protein